MNKKVQKILLFLYIIAFGFTCVGATFAYFTVIRVSNVSPKVEVTAATTDFITFDSGTPIRINPTSYNFGKGMGNLFSETFASAYLRLGSDSKSAQYKYNLALNINKNNLEYSTEEKKPELIMQIVDYDEKVLENIEGLDYVTVTDGDGNEISGFDITTALGTYYIVKDFPISTINETTHMWKAKFIFVNLSESQDKNFEKVLEGYIRIEKAGEV